jgi:shikimate kinase
MAPVVVLVGPMGVGKTTVGELIAERLGTTCRDTDADIVAAQGRPIADIFVDDGEEHFRALESAAVRAALAELPVVFLDMGVAEAVKRVGLDGARPLLLVNPRKQWRELMEARRPLYTEVARAVVSTEDRSPQDVADAVMDALELKNT